MVKTYTEEMKRQIVELRKTGRSTTSLSREYGMSTSTICGWEKQFANAGESGAQAGRSEVEKQLRDALKQNKQLRMENDILKQAALIFAQREK